MKFPEIPTDNLYKFIAISGLMILLLCYLIPYYRHYNLRLKLLQFDAEVAELDIDTDRNREETDELRLVLDEFQKRLKLADPNEMIGYMEESKEIKKMNLQQIELSYQQNKRLARLEAKHRQHVFINNKIKKESALSIIGSVFGFLMVCVGFLLWYKKLQAPLDTIIKNSANSK